MKAFGALVDTLCVHFTASINGPDNGTALPADPSKSFTGTARAARMPKLEYPNDKTMLPPNLALLDVHWEPGGASNTLFQLSFESVSVADGDATAVDTLFINDGTTGVRNSAESIVEPNLVDHPDWSPNGNSIAFTHPTSLAGGVKQTPYQSGIDVITKTGTTWSAATPLVASLAGKNRFNPNFSPDSAVVIFTESTCQNGTTNDDTCDADSDPSARTWAVKASGGAPFELANANAPGVEDTGTDERHVSALRAVRRAARHGQAGLDYGRVGAQRRRAGAAGKWNAPRTTKVVGSPPPR